MAPLAGQEALMTILPNDEMVTPEILMLPQTKAVIGVAVLNRMLEAGRPDSVR